MGQEWKHRKGKAEKRGYPVEKGLQLARGENGEVGRPLTPHSVAISLPPCDFPTGCSPFSTITFHVPSFTHLFQFPSLWSSLTSSIPIYFYSTPSFFLYPKILTSAESVYIPEVLSDFPSINTYFDFFLMKQGFELMALCLPGRLSHTPALGWRKYFLLTYRDVIGSNHRLLSLFFSLQDF
jgi:hypothetical protein